MQVQTVWHHGSEWHDWRRFLLQTATTLTILLLGGAIICWVAANWPTWGRFERLALTQGAMTSVALAALVSLWVRRDQTATRRSLPAALLGLGCVCLGAVLALVGQTYQTGADTSALFISWCVLMLPWAIAARSPSVWSLWAVVVNVAVVLYSREHALGFSGGSGSLDLTDAAIGMTTVWLAPLNLALLAAWKLIARGHLAQVKAGPRLLAALALAAATLSALWSPLSLLQGILPWLWTLAALVLVHRHARPDGEVLALAVLSMLVVVLRYGWQILDGDAWEAMMMLTIVTTLVAGALGHAWISRANARPMKGNPAAPDVEVVSGVLLAIAAIACWACIHFRLGGLSASMFGMDGTVVPDSSPGLPGIVPVGMLSHTGMGVAAAIHLVVLALYIIVGRRALRRRQLPDRAWSAEASLAPATGADADAARVRPTTPHADATGPAAPYRSMASTALLTVTSWFAAVVLLALLVLTELLSLNHSSLWLGMVMVIMSAIGLRASRGIFVTQGCVAIGLVGLLIVYAQTFAGFMPAIAGMWLTMAVGLAMYAASPRVLMRFLAGSVIALAVATLVWATRTNDVLDVVGEVGEMMLYADRQSPPQWTIVAALLAAIATVLFIADMCAARLARLGLRPMAWAFAIMATQFAWLSSGAAISDVHDLWTHGRSRGMVFALVAGACLPAISAGVAMMRHGRALPRLSQIFVPVALLALAALWLPTPGIAYALTWMVLGFASRQRTLLAAGSAALVIYLLAYYYQLGMPLIDKALWLGMTGIAVGLACVALSRTRARRTSHALSGGHPDAIMAGARSVAETSAYANAGAGAHTGGYSSADAHAGGDDGHRPDSRAGHAWLAAPRRRWRVVATAAGLLAILATVNATVWQRERLLATGQDLLLRLAPVDPRSMMQGDYMALDFSLGRQIAKLHYAGQAGAAGREGYAILTRDADHVGRLVRIQAQPTPRAPDELALRYRWVEGDVQIVTNAFFFAEGHAERYERSRYGAFKVAPDGQALLTGLRQAEDVPGHDASEPDAFDSTDLPEAVAPDSLGGAVESDAPSSHEPIQAVEPPPVVR